MTCSAIGRRSTSYVSNRAGPASPRMTEASFHARLSASPIPVGSVASMMPTPTTITERIAQVIEDAVSTVD